MKVHKKIFIFWGIFFTLSVFVLTGVFFRGVFKEDKNSIIEDKTIQPPCEARAVFGETQYICLEIANTPEKRRQGLSGRESFQEDAGMLFVFDFETKPQMWMKDMKFSLDFVWIDDEGIVRDIHTDIAPETYPQTFAPKEDVRFVLELLSGGVNQYDIQEGQQIHFEDFGVL